MQEPQAPNHAGKLKPIHLEYARSFLSASMVLDEASPARDSDAPVYFLSAHALELTLKALLVRIGHCEDDLRKIGHNLAALYNRSLLTEYGRRTIDDAERRSRSQWKAFFRASRTEYLSRTGNDISMYDEEDNVPTNYDIGQRLPRLVDAVAWLSDRHFKRGSAFRYAKTGPDTRLHFTCFDLNKRIVPQTVYWVCEAILLQLGDALNQDRRAALLKQRMI